MNETIEKNETIEAAEQEAAKPYTFRKLCAKDVFPMVGIIKKIGLKEFKAFFEGEGISKIMKIFTVQKSEKTVEDSAEETSAEKTVEELGFSLALEMAEIIFCNLESCENDIFKFLASISEMKVEDVRNLDLATFAEMVIDFFKKDDFRDFFKVVSKSF